MITYQNQKVITIAKQQSSKEDLYFIANNNNTFQALRILNAPTFALYLYLTSNQIGYQLALSPSDVCKKTGISTASYNRATKELMEKGYLIAKKENSNQFDFFDYPYQVDSTPYQNDSIEPYPDDKTTYQKDITPYQDDIIPYQKDKRNTTYTTDNINNNTIDNTIGSDGVFLCNNYNDVEEDIDSELEDILKLYDINPKYYKTTTNYFWEQVDKHKLKDKVSLSNVLDYWTKTKSSLERSRPHGVNIPIRYDLNIVIDTMLKGQKTKSLENKPIKEIVETTSTSNILPTFLRSLKKDHPTLTKILDEYDMTLVDLIPYDKQLQAKYNEIWIDDRKEHFDNIIKKWQDFIFVYKFDEQKSKGQNFIEIFDKVSNDTSSDDALPF